MVRALGFFLILASWGGYGLSADLRSLELDRGNRPAEAGIFICGGEVEQAVWTSWETSVKRYLQQDLLEHRLLNHGDVYALYDFEIFAHNMVLMARRCHRTHRLREVAELINKSYSALTEGTALSPGRRWICRGGSVCTNKNHLLDNEVILCSVQFLAMAASVANALAIQERSLTREDKAFIKETVSVAADHLLRWGGWVTVYRLKWQAAASADDVTNSSSALFFTDKSLWMITIYSELSGIVRNLSPAAAALPSGFAERQRAHLKALLRLFKSRVTIRHLPFSRIGPVDVADIDRGYWRLYADNQYAGYENEKKPALCTIGKEAGSTQKPELQISPSAVTRRQDTGWDFSHARRLVPALDAIGRNREALQILFALSRDDLPGNDLATSFANNLLAVIWNGDVAKPLFANYWSGANGWFRVAYDNGTGECREGYPPYGLTDAFATGGYAAWTRYRPEIGLPAKALYWLLRDESRESKAFIAKYYPSFSDNEDGRITALTQFAFQASLVAVGIP
ncbi:hypothetical protein SAMN06265795_104314 [Noviherbaspirillum humi]|uniref:Uncharacterized protein n=2 Tax=Noviherbaspirillum humi TaxID=1688639 RepID=A0A239G9Q8_9BURK|nr:hypothetical protein SAMN06265795_104314 [Noviherbaspirillum humi]